MAYSAPSSSVSHSHSPSASAAPNASTPPSVSRASGPAQIKRIGHTCAWTVTGHLDRQTFEQLKTFCQTHPSLSASIARKQLEIAVRRAAKDTGRRLKLARYDILDMTNENADAHPVVARASRRYKLEQNLFAGPHSDTYLRLARRYREVQGTVHSTIACNIIKRYVKGRLSSLSLRDHGGVNFVPKKREARLLALSDFLEQSGIGHITRIPVGDDPAAKSLVAGNIGRIVDAQIQDVREAFEESDLSDSESRKRLRDKVADMRRQIAEMQDLFGFAKKTLNEKESQARALMKHIMRGQRSLPEELFGGLERNAA